VVKIGGIGITLLLELIVVLWKAFRLRVLHKGEEFSLPHCDRSRLPTYPNIHRIAAFIDFTLYLLLFWKPGRCFYRSFVLATLLRRRGLPLELNFGLRQQGRGKWTPQAHCWLTLNGELYREKGDPSESYPVPLGNRCDIIKYWYRPG
jgi:hypothetical protein